MHSQWMPTYSNCANSIAICINRTSSASSTSSGISSAQSNSLTSPTTSLWAVSSPGDCISSTKSKGIEELSLTERFITASAAVVVFRTLVVTTVVVVFRTLGKERPTVGDVGTATVAVVVMGTSVS
jgi:hypothetical protein